MNNKLVAAGLSKSFGPVHALRDFSGEFLPGEIHAVLGENGAGKSTLVNILSGFLRPDAGEFRLGDRRLDREDVGMVHQHFKLVPEFTVAENLALARTKGLFRPLDVAAAAQSALDLARRLGWEVPGDAKVRTLPVGVQQRIEILKCLSGEAPVLILDEPTAVLTPEEVEDLFRVIRQVKKEGRIVVLIAHKLDEVLAIADRVTVLRLGEKVASALIGEVDAPRLAHWMVGEMPPLRNEGQPGATGEGLEVRDLHVLGDRRNEAVRGVSFEIRSGEILGFGGVDGNGQVELAEALAQIRPAKGSAKWKGRDLETESPAVAYIPQDRQQDGLALSMSILDNLLIRGIRISKVARGGYISSGASRTWAKGLVSRFSIKVDSLDKPVSDLSGGNQQKIVVSRTLDETPGLLVAVNPTRGLDIKATRYVQDQISEARKAGAAVALFSTDLDELAELADRTVFMSRGRLIEGADAEALLGSPS